MGNSKQKLFIITLWALLIGWFGFGATGVFAAPISGRIFEITNNYVDHSGKEVAAKIKVKVWGDEFYTHVETLNGYTLIRDPQTYYICYAIPGKDGELLSSKIVYTGTGTKEELDFERFGRKQMRESVTKINEKARINKARLGTKRPTHVKPVENTTKAGLSNPYYNPYYAGSIIGLTLLVDFPEERATFTQEQVENFCNSLTYNEFGNNGSVRKYYMDVSDGAVDYTNIVAPYYTAKNNKSYYTNPEIGYGVRAQELAMEALTELANKGFNFNQLSKDQSGNVRALNIFYAGSSGNAWAEGLWPHQGGLPGEAVFNGVSFGAYQISNMPEDLRIGTFAHENGHMVFGWPDTYDYSYLSFGLGAHDLMAYCNGVNPQLPNPYFRNVLAGWGEIEILNNRSSNTTVSVQANRIGTQVYKRNTEKEFFFVENIDVTLVAGNRHSNYPTSGIYIWHADSNVTTGNNESDMTPEKHYLISLEQSNGNFGLERNTHDNDSTNPYRADYVGCGTSFTDATVPDSKWWDGSSSGLNITNISNAGSTMTYIFKTQLEAYAVTFHTVSGNGMLTATANGKAIASGDVILEGADVVFTATPNSDYRIKEWQYNGTTVDGTAATYSLSDLQAPATVTVAFESACATPPAVGISGGGITQTSAIINWEGGASRYAVEYKTSAETAWTVWSTNLTTNTATLTPLEPNTTYDVRVKAFCSTGDESEYGTLTFSNTPVFSWEIGYPVAEDITANFYDGGTFAITGTGAMMDWNDHSRSYRSIKDEIVSVVINSGVTTIGDCAFQVCSNLTSVSIPNTVERIGNLAFDQSENLASITIPNSVQFIGDWAFATGCFEMKIIDIPGSVNYIGNEAFGGLYGLTDVTVHWETPLLVQNPFGPYNKGLINLHVPEGTECLYAASPEWQNFNIAGVQITATAGSGGSISPETLNVTCGNSIDFTFTPDTGYEITQVLVDGADVGAVSSYTFSDVTAHHTIEVTFEPVTYTMSYHGNGNTGGDTPSGSYTYNVPQDLTCNGYTRAYAVTFNYNGNGDPTTTTTVDHTFKEWSSTPSGEGTLYTDCQSVMNLAATNGETVTLYAQWNAGSVILPTPSPRANYTFEGWYTATSGGTGVGKEGDTFTPTADVTLYARFKLFTYTVSYHGNGNTGGDTPSVSYTYNEPKNLTCNGYTRAYAVTFNYNGNGNPATTTTVDYTFKEWSSTPSGGSPIYTDCQSVMNLAATNGETVTLYAQWNAGSVILPTPSPRANYTFEGWYTATSGGTGVGKEGDTFTPTADVTLYAQWSKITGTAGEQARQFQIYPNPFTGEVRITVATMTATMGHAPLLKIINAAGVIVHTQMISSPDETIRLEHLPAGVYFFSVEQDESTQTVKVAKE